ncbi:MAG: hypothetical protein HOE48_18990, partial [Candidatus Latescibacteria bacterium]|nr:hypothetical protein [Candidatus Latescibacterota bacterium]
RYANEAYQISVRKVGEGTSLTGHLGLAYGLGNSVDIGITVPVMFDVAGGLAKYGSGDITTTLKFGFPGKFPSNYYFGFDFSMLHPYGYKGRTALNVRPYSREGREIASRVMLDINREAIGFRANIGYIFSAVSRDPGLMYGGAVEVGRGQVFTMTGEYWSEPSAIGGQTKRAILGARMNLWRLKLEAGVEKGLSPDLPDVTAMAGIRLQPKLGGGRKHQHSSIVRVPKNIETTVRVAVINLVGFEHQRAGELVAQEIKTKLSRYAHIRLVDVGKDTKYLDPDAALRLAQEANVDVVITGRILRHEMARGSKPNLPLVVGVPQTRAHMAADIRVIDRREGSNVLSFSLQGVGQQSRGLRMFPTSGDDRTSYLSALDKQRVWTEAIVHMLTDLYEGMHDEFDWFPG